MLKYKEFVKSITENISYVSSDFLVEGGAYGHLQHPFDDMNLSFLDLEELIKLTVEGGFSPDNFLQTKCVEGEAIVIKKKMVLLN